VIGEESTGCQLCEQACPVLVSDQYQYELVGRKAACIPFSIASPRVAAIDIDNCTLRGACEKVCPTKCIDFTQTIEINVGSVLMATGFDSYTPANSEFGYSQFENVVTLPQFTRIIELNDKNLVFKGKEIKNIAYILRWKPSN